MDKKKNPTLIGRVEIVSFPEININDSHARIDTGARTSTIWVSSARIEDGRLAVQFYGQGHPLFTGETFYYDDFTEMVVFSSNGQSDDRYVIKLLVCIGGRKIRARFTLADRSTQTYPVLIGRNVLRGKFIVDVKLGSPVADEKEQRQRRVRAHYSKGV